MGSDTAPINELSALELLKEDPLCDILVVGKGDYENDVTDLGYRFRLADEVVGMHEIPTVAVRQKKNSSLNSWKGNILFFCWDGIVRSGMRVLFFLIAFIQKHLRVMVSLMPENTAILS